LHKEILYVLAISKTTKTFEAEVNDRLENKIRDVDEKKLRISSCV